MPCALHPAVVDGLNACSRCMKQFCGDCLIELRGNRFCAGCKSEAVKDMQSGVSGTELRLATRLQRFAALLLDSLLQSMVTIPLLFLMGGMSQFQQQAMGGGNASAVGSAGIQMLLNIVFVGLGISYEALFLQFKGATPGKMALGLRVVGPDGEPLTPGQCWLRAFIRSLIGACMGIDYWVSLFRKDKCCIHDLAAKTRVIKV